MQQRGFSHNVFKKTVCQAFFSADLFIETTGPQLFFLLHRCFDCIVKADDGRNNKLGNKKLFCINSISDYSFFPAWKYL